MSSWWESCTEITYLEPVNQYITSEIQKTTLLETLHARFFKKQLLTPENAAKHLKGLHQLPETNNFPMNHVSPSQMGLITGTGSSKVAFNVTWTKQSLCMEKLPTKQQPDPGISCSKCDLLYFSIEKSKYLPDAPTCPHLLFFAACYEQPPFLS